MVSNWRENSKSLVHLKDKRFRKMPFVRWYSEFIRPSSNDTWLEKLTSYETLLCQIYGHKEIDPQKAAFYRQNLTAVSLNSTNDGTNDIFQRRVNELFGSMRRNVTVVVTKTLMANMRFKKFVQSFETYFRILDIPLTAVEWGELTAVQAEFDNITHLSNEKWIVPKMTTHNRGRELLAAREVLHDSASGAFVPSSLVNNAAKWMTLQATHLSATHWAFVGETTITFTVGIIMLLYFVARKFMG
jgi:hypothetical protein